MQLGLHLDQGVTSFTHALGDHIAHFVVLNGSQFESIPAHAVGRFNLGRPYRMYKASVNSPLCSTVPWSYDGLRSPSLKHPFSSGFQCEFQLRRGMLKNRIELGFLALFIHDVDIAAELLDFDE